MNKLREVNFHILAYPTNITLFCLPVTCLLGKLRWTFLFVTAGLAVTAMLSCGQPTTPDPATARGVQMIDELIACDTPGVWDRATMLKALEDRKQDYIDLLEMQLESCLYAKSVTPTPAPTLAPTATRTVEEMMDSVCAGFGELLTTLDEMNLTSQEKMDFLLSEGFSEEELATLATECSRP